ncbi:hypothetical protein IV203_023163 [Nitzschia inconspicua]|uniref:Uncharacterized protein n=1 Tax=Nitzschia inconspicua TaxID=303405 RepID=A0A9K3KD12_9STRA|nr:hypothetical protein IV203_023163 [Nitzschia inconspicua]
MMAGGSRNEEPTIHKLRSSVKSIQVIYEVVTASRYNSVYSGIIRDETWTCRKLRITFKDCVPAENRAQVLHQALVTQFDYGLFVTSKVQGGEGNLVQVVVMEIPASVGTTHGLVSCAVATLLLGFLQGEHVVKRGVLIDDDFPPLGNSATESNPEVTGKAILCSSETHHTGRWDVAANEAAVAVQALSTASVQQTKTRAGYEHGAVR